MEEDVAGSAVGASAMVAAWADSEERASGAGAVTAAWGRADAATAAWGRAAAAWGVAGGASCGAGMASGEAMAASGAAAAATGAAGVASDATHAAQVDSGAMASGAVVVAMGEPPTRRLAAGDTFGTELNSSGAGMRPPSTVGQQHNRLGMEQLRSSTARMDENISFLLKIKLLGNRKKARQDVRCFCFEMVVDSDLTNYKDFIESVVEKYPPGYLEVPHVLKTFPEVKSDQELMSMFDIHTKEKIVDMFISYCGPSETFEPITVWEFDVEEQPENNIVEDDDDYLRNPLPENEHVGVDDEIMYLDIVPANVVVVPRSFEKRKEKVVAEDGLDDEAADGSEDEFEDEDELEADEDEPYEEVKGPEVVQINLTHFQLSFLLAKINQKALSS